MKSRRSEIDGLIDLLIKSFKRSKNLPYSIKTNLCPTRKKNCTRHHGEIVVQSYDKNTGKFYCVYYGVHVPRKVFEFEQLEDVVRAMIKKSVSNAHHERKPLVSVKELKRTIYTDGKNNKQMMTFRCTYEEKLIIIAKAKKSGMDPSNYMKMRSLS